MKWSRGGKLSGVAVVMALTLLAAACGSSSSKSSNASSGGSTGTGGTTGATTGATTGSSGSSNYPAIPAGPIKIGIDTSLSGPLAAYGVSGAANYKALVNLVNKNGGVDGHPIDLTIENDQGSTTIAATAGLKLISDKIAASLYPGFTGMDNVVAPLFNQHKICTVWNIDDPKFLNASQYPCFYTLLDLGPIQTEAIAKYAASKGLTRVGVIYDTLPTDTVTYSDFQTAAKDQGVTITKAVQVPLTAVDASTQVSEMEASGAQAVYVLAVGAQAAIFKALQTQGWSKPVLTEIGAVTPAYATLGPLASKTEFSCGQAVPAGYQLTQEMTEIASIGKANSPGNPFYAYNGAVPNEQVLLLVYAMEKYHSTSYDAIMNAINGAQNLTLSSPLWKYTFSPTQHDGYSQDQEHMCSASAQPIDGYPVYNWSYSDS